MSEIIKQILNSASVIDYSIVIFSVLISTIIVSYSKNIIISKLATKIKKTKNRLDDNVIHILEELHWPFFLLLFSYIGVQYLPINVDTEQTISTLLIISITFFATRAITELIVYILTRTIFVKQNTDPAFKDFSGILITVFIWVISLLTVLQNLGFNVTALATGLGIGGIAIAFALQNVLSDIFASFSIYFDKPFSPGDIVGISSGNSTDLGKIQKIGIKSTRIETLEGEELIMSNKELTSLKIRNYSRMKKRRVVLNTCVSINTPIKSLKQIPTSFQNSISNINQTEFDRSNLCGINSIGYTFETVIYIPSSDYNLFMEVQEQVLLSMLDILQKNQIQIALPTQVIQLEN